MQTLRLFCDVARLCSISGAAAEHGITQSAVSQRISHLEKKLGVTLLDRSVRPLQLTEAGQAYLRGCQDLLEQQQRLEQKVSQMCQLDGHLHVDAIYSAGIDLLNHIRRGFADEHQRVTVTVEYGRPEQVHQHVRQGRSDLGIVSYPKQWRDVAMIPLRDERMVLVCQWDHPAARLQNARATQLAQWPMVTFEPQLPVGRQIRKYLRGHGVSPNIDSVFDNVDTIKSAVAVTDRVAILPRRTVLRELAAETLAAVELQPPLLRPLGIIHTRRSNGNGLAPLAQAFVDFLLKHAGPDVDLVDQVTAQHTKFAGNVA